MPPIRLIKPLVAALIVLFACQTGWATTGILGNQTLETAAAVTIENQHRGGVFKMPSTPQTASADSITFYIDLGAVGTINLRCALYLWRGSANNATLVDTTAELILSGASDGWKSLALLNLANIYKDSTYLIVAWGGTAGGNNEIRFDDAAGGDTLASKSVTYVGATWSDPLTGTTTLNANKMSIYLTYTYVTENAAAEGDTTACKIGVSDTIFATSAGIRDIIQQARFTAPVDATTKSMRVYTLSTGSGGTRTIKCAVYKDADSVLVDTTEQRVFNTAAEATGYHTYTFPTPKTIVAGTVYRLSAWAALGGTSVSIKAKSSGGNNRIENGQTYSSWPSPTDQPGFVGVGHNVSIALFYVCPASTIKGRRRKLIETRGTGYFIKEAKSTFAGDWYDEIAK